MTCAFADPKEWLLEIAPTTQAQLWQQSQLYSTPSSRWCAYINQICLHGFMDWVQTEYGEQPTVWESSPNVPAFWEFVNGTAIVLNDKRVVLIPTEAIDDGELEVPQEWVDIPGWQADFYLVVQVKPDEDYVRFWGYTTHQELKEKASYDSVDRTYCMDARHLTKDLNAFSMAYQFCQTEDLKVISTLPELSTIQAENLLQRLSNSQAMFPRLEVPFSSWGALLKKEQWRQQLYQQRQQSQQINSSLRSNLSDWVQGIYEASWQAIDTFLNSNSNNLAFNFRSGAGLTAAGVKRAKVIDLGTQAESVKVILLVSLIAFSQQKMGIRVQLHPFNDRHLPLNIKLVLKDESAQIIQEVPARVQDNFVQLRLFEGEVGECFTIQVILDSYQTTENFMI
jgi:hypothetical protein